MHLPPSIVRAGLRLSRPVFASPRLSVAQKRRAVDALASAGRAPAGARYDSATVGGVAVRVVSSGDHPRGTLLYLHGGGYALGSARGYQGFAAHLAGAAGMTAVVPEYSRSPESPHPVALEEVAGVFTELAADRARLPVVVAGDSAGGGLALALAMRLRDAGAPMPAALGLICPWLDLKADVQRSRLARRDPLIVPGMLTGWAGVYAGEADPAHPLISPLHGDLAGLPPMVVHSAVDDPIAADAEALQRRVAATRGAGELRHRTWPDRWHCFHLQAGILRDADDAVRDLGGELAARAAAATTSADRGLLPG